MEYQVQINSIKAKLQETRARKKQQEELIMKVENQALKVSRAHMGTRSVKGGQCLWSGKGHLSDWHGVKGDFLSERPSGHGRRQRHACKPVERGALRGTNPVFAALSSQNRFQALLDEIIQQEEREMEQVKTLSQNRCNPGSTSLELLTRVSYYMCSHLAVIYKP